MVKKITLWIAISVLGTGAAFSQENPPESGAGINLYTFFVNIVGEQFRFPLVGFVNIAGGSHSAPQVGFINWNQNNFSSVQAGFVNTVGGDTAGLQLGFINTTAGSFRGAQIGFVNTVAGDTSGPQLGFINTVAGSFGGTQIGFVNIVAGEEFRGLQLGFVNIAPPNVSGTQISFLNIARRVSGFQFGFINYAESVENGIPIGFISIVREGGYRAIELSVNEMLPLNLAFKIGVERFYTSLGVSYNPAEDGFRNAIFTRVGFGTIITIGDSFFLNPELITTNNIGYDTSLILSLTPMFGVRLVSGLSILAGPSITWIYGDDPPQPLFDIHTYEINNRNRLLIGGRIAVRYEW
ncbi:MAG: hypothetical protein FWC64_03020 [Treponema sp.]|nr:hypothetical protein [Treponema sp.]